MAHKGTVLVVDDAPDLLEIIGMRLLDDGYDVRLAGGGREGLESARKVVPDLLILDVNMPGMDGLQLKASLNHDEMTAEIPTIFLSASDGTKKKVEGFSLRADDYVTKPFIMDELMARVESTLKRHKRYVDISMTDKLTGLYNLHVYKKQISSLFNVAKRYGRNLSLAIIDVDHLKITNDTQGHQKGDFVIKKVAELMKLAFRKPDVLIRYGGDEFVVLMPESTKEQATKAIRRFRDQLEAELFTMEGYDQKIAISVSCGISSYEDNLLNGEQLFEMADKNLYKEKAYKKTQ